MSSAQPRAEAPQVPQRSVAPRPSRPPAAAPRRVETPPAAAMVLAPIVGLGLWVGIIALLVG